MCYDPLTGTHYPRHEEYVGHRWEMQGKCCRCYEVTDEKLAAACRRRIELYDRQLANETSRRVPRRSPQNPQGRV